MLRFTLKFVFVLAKLVLRVPAIMGGLVFASFGNAALAMLNTDAEPDTEDTSTPNAFIVDEHSAQRAYNEGRMSAFQSVYFNED